MGRAASNVPLRDPDTKVAIGNLIVQAKDAEGRAFLYEIVDEGGHFITGGVVSVAVDFPINLNADLVAHGLSQQLHKDMAIATVSGQFSTSGVDKGSEGEAAVDAEYTDHDKALDALEREYRYRMLIDTLSLFEASEVEAMDFGLDAEMGMELSIPFIE